MVSNLPHSVQWSSAKNYYNIIVLVGWVILTLQSWRSSTRSLDHAMHVATTAATAPMTTRPLQQQSHHSHVRPAALGPHNEPLSLGLGDLPGYTGWARPSTTMAPYFSIVGDSGPSRVGENWTITIECQWPDDDDVHDNDNDEFTFRHYCTHGGSYFYVRAYGPAILPGDVTDLGNGRYDVTFLPFDAGTYIVEVVLTFSTPPPLEQMPRNDLQVAYEGYLLPGFPLEWTVAPTATTTTHSSSSGGASTPVPTRRPCTTADLIDTPTHNGFNNGRWVVTSKVNDGRNGQTRIQIPGNSSDTDFVLYYEPVHDGYRNGTNSLGFTTEYHYLHCRLLSQEELVAKAKKRVQQVQADPSFKPLHLHYIGDSNYFRQVRFFYNYFRTVPNGTLFDITHHWIVGGMTVNLPSMNQSLHALREEDTSHRHVVLFNSGLHDIVCLCGKSSGIFEDRHNYIDIPDEQFSCLQQYQETMQELVEELQSFPAVLKIWQSTPSGWPKYGNYGAAWPPGALQGLPLSPESIPSFNRAVNHVLHNVPQEKSDVPIYSLDSYWMSVSRPDNREVDAINKLGSHMSHLGDAIFDVLVRRFATMLLEVL